MSAASYRPILWLTPPPHFTAYFWRARRPGRVLRVSRTLALVPAKACVHCHVAVAMPDRWVSRFRAVRSARSTALVWPLTAMRTGPGGPGPPASARGCEAPAERPDHAA